MPFDPSTAVAEGFDPTTAQPESSVGTFDVSSAQPDWESPNTVDWHNREAARLQSLPGGAPKETPLVEDRSGVDALARLADPATLVSLDAGMGAMRDALSTETTNKSLVHLPKPEGDSRVAGVTRGVENAIEGLATPENIGLMTLLGGAPSVIQKAAGALFGGQAAFGALKEGSAAIHAETPGAQFEHGTNAVINAGLAALGGHAVLREGAPVVAEVKPAEVAPIEPKITTSAVTTQGTPSPELEAQRMLANMLPRQEQPIIGKDTQPLTPPSTPTAPASAQAAPAAKVVETPLPADVVQPPEGSIGHTTITSGTRSAKVTEYPDHVYLADIFTSDPKGAGSSKDILEAVKTKGKPIEVTVGRRSGDSDAASLAKVYARYGFKPVGELGERGIPNRMRWEPAGAGDQKRIPTEEDARTPKGDAGDQVPDYTLGAARADNPIDFPEQRTTRLKKAVVADERIQRGLEDLPPAERQGETERVQKAEDRVDNDPTLAGSIVRRIVDDGEHAISPDDAAVLLVERTRLGNERQVWQERAAESGDASESDARLADIEAQMHRLDQAQRLAGSSWGRVGHLYQRMMRSDYTLEPMLSRARAARGRALEPDEVSEVQRQADEIAAAQKAADAALDIESQAAEQADIQRVHDAASAVEVEVPAVKWSVRVLEAARKHVEKLKAEAAPSLAELRRILGSETGGVGGTGGGPGMRGRKLNEPRGESNAALTTHLAKVIHAELAEFALTRAEMLQKIVALVGDNARPFFEKAWELGNKAFDAGLAKLSGDEKKAVRGTRKKNQKDPVAALATAKAEAVAGSELSHGVVFDYVRALLKSGVKEADVMKAAHDGLKEFFPNIKQRDVNRAYVEYGKKTFPSKDELKVTERHLRQAVKIQEDIDRLEKDKLRPEKQGYQRDKADIAIRDLMRKRNDLLKTSDIPPDAGKLASIDEAKQARLKNAIEEMDRQIQTETKVPRAAGAPDSPAVDRLKMELKAMRDLWDEIEASKNPPPTPEHIKQLEALEKKERELTEKIATGDIDPKTGKPTADTAEVASAKERLAKLRQQIAEMRNGPKPTAAEKQVSELEKIRERLNETLSGARSPTPSKPFDALSTAAEDIKLEIEAMREMAAQMRRDAKARPDVDARAEAAKIKALEAAIERYRAKTAAGDFTSKPNTKLGPDTARVAALKEVLASRKSMYEAAKKAGNPILTPEERLNAQRVKQWTNRADEIAAKIKAGDFSKPTKVKVPLNSAAEKAKAVLDQKKLEFARKTAEWERERWTGFQKAWDKVMQTSALPRAILSSFDISAVGRQGGFLSMGNPRAMGRALGEMARSMKNEADFQQAQAALSLRENAKNGYYDQGKLFLADRADTALSAREEVLNSRWAEKIPGFGNGIRVSNRAYVGFLNRLRADMFDALVDAVGKGGKLSKPELELIGNYINVATGRGDLGRMSGYADGLAAILFAPRLWASRWQMLTGQPIRRGAFTALKHGQPLSLRARAFVAREYAKSLTGIAVMLGLAGIAGTSVELDPRSTDFLKLKWGNTRADITSGISQAAVDLTRVLTGKIKRSNGVVAKQERISTIGTRVRNKLAPIPGAAWDALDIAQDTKTPPGHPETLGGVAGGLTLPLTLQPGELKRLMEEQGVPAGVAIKLLDLAGFSTQTYDSTSNKK